MNVVSTKADLRRRVRQQRQKRNAGADESTRISEHIMDLEDVRSACDRQDVIACYLARDDEPPTWDLINDVRRAGGRVVLPRISDDDLVWVEMTDNTRMVTNTWGIDEPEGPQAPTPPAVWIIPALAVDADGYRLGQGGGFYDRALAQRLSEDNALVIAVIFEDESVMHVAHEDHDQRVDVVVTPERVRWLSMPD
ncbi:MAG: 5-formyltetrahydrofolate cyclo-ligase [Actinomycetales bacterium]|nr:5-formyltetrahydrofolate cyclo-ligase [Actinomycetales bacterium]